MAASLGDWKVLGQADLAAATLTDVYTVPASTKAEAHNVIFCNRGAATSVRLAISPNGAAIANQHYLLYDYAIGLNGIVNWAGLSGGEPIRLGDTDVVRCYSTLATVSVNILGKEVGA